MNAQKGFHFKKQTRSFVKVPFRLLGNLMVLDIKLNEVPLSFILDTGANHTFLFNLANTDSLKLKSVQKIKVKGLGSLGSVESIKSLNNKFEIKSLVNNNQDIRLILDQGINFSSQLGIPIHGIIGCNLFENFVIKINYSAQNIKFYKPEMYKYKKVEKYNELDLLLDHKRMYINTKIAIEADYLPSTSMLLDTGSSDSVWLFENKERGIKAPDKKFRDYMGTGIGGAIHGNRSRLKKIRITDFELSDVKVAFPDSVDVALAYKNKNRQGSIGSGVLKRFNMVFDYGNKKMYLKKNKFFEKPFEYNMSGIEIEHDGLRIEKVFDGKVQFSEEARKSDNARKAYVINSLVKSSLVPVFKIVQVREKSPAKIAGVQQGDILLRVNKKETYRYQLSEIIAMLSDEQGKNLEIEVERNGKEMKFSFRLKRLL